MDPVVRFLAPAAALVLLLSSCNREEASPAAKAVQRTRIPGEQWIVVGVEKRISATETMRILRVASSVAPNLRQLDRSCLLYRNDELQSSQVICPEGVPDLSFYGD